MKKWIFILSILCSGLSYAESVLKVSRTDISKFRSHSAEHPAGGARKTQMFYANGLTSPCIGLYYKSDTNPGMHSMLLAAYMAKESITLRYSNDVTSPWGDSRICRLNSITLAE